MLNIAIIESAHVPATPVTPVGLRLAMSIGLALIVSIGLVTMAEYFDPTFRTPAEVTRLLAMPVLASIPANTDTGGLVARP
jgi:capsular polysaccharide biosynthesis protein